MLIAQQPAQSTSIVGAKRVQMLLKDVIALSVSQTYLLKRFFQIVLRGQARIGSIMHHCVDTFGDFRTVKRSMARFQITLGASLFRLLFSRA
jgi:hypothetical protein